MRTVFMRGKEDSLQVEITEANDPGMDKTQYVIITQCTYEGVTVLEGVYDDPQDVIDCLKEIGTGFDTGDPTFQLSSEMKLLTTGTESFGDMLRKI